MTDTSEKLSKRFQSAKKGVSLQVNIDGVAAHLNDVTVLHGSNHADHHGSDPKLVEEISAADLDILTSGPSDKKG